MDGFEDEDIARAIALSLQEAKMAPTPPPTQPRVPANPEPQDIPIAQTIASTLQQDDDDVLFQAELERAIEISKAESQPPTQELKQEPLEAVSSALVLQPLTQTSAPQSPSRYSDSPLMFDRAQMERERLARQKRLRPDIIHQSTSGQSQDDRASEGEDGEYNRDRKRQRLSQPLYSRPRTDAASSSTGPEAGPSSSRSQVPNGSQGTGTKVKQEGGGMLWEGAIRQTANRHVDQGENSRSFRLSEIFGPRDELMFVIISAYCVNFPWLYGFFNPSTPVIVVAQDPEGNETLKEVLPNWIKTTPFLRGGRGCMHMKFMLLFYKTGRLRVVVSTANLIEIDWRDIENTVWVQDVPKRPEPVPHDKKATDFAATWTRVLRGVNVVPALLTLQKNGHEDLPITRVEDIRCRWDFSKVKVQLVPSLAGKHEGWPKVVQTGHPALMKAVRDIGGRPRKGKELILECQGSSIGTYSAQWMNEFYCSAKGDSAEEWLDQPRSRRTKLPFPTIRILFPSTKTVRESALGEPGGGTMFCRRHQWEGSRFPRDHFFDSKSKRGRVLMHSKMIIATYRETGFVMNGKTRAVTPHSGSDDDSDDSDIVEVNLHRGEKLTGWAYMGSHNFTPSAWGTLSGSAFNPTLNVTNYELGIVLPLKSEEEVNAVACWERPAKKYIIGKDEPWIQSESAYFVGGA